MSKSQQFEKALVQAKEKEKKYDWLEAAEIYEQALNTVRKDDFLRKGEIQEKIGYCFYRAAFQAETRKEFKNRMKLSVEAYEEAVGLLEKLEDSKKQAKINSFTGTALHNKSWLTKDSSERKALLDECQKFEKAALKTYAETDDRLGYGKTCNELLTCLYDRLLVTWDPQERKNILEEAIKIGEGAIETLSEVRDKQELARAHYMLSLHLLWAAFYYESIKKQEEIIKRSLAYAQKASDISGKTGNPYLIGMSNYAIGWNIINFEGDLESSLRCGEKTLEQGTRTRDDLMIAQAYEILAVVSWIKTKMEDDPDKRRKGFNKAIQYAEDAITRYERVSYPFTTLYGTHTDCYSELASCETSLEAKRVLLEKAIEVGGRILERAKRSGSIAMDWVQWQLFRSLSKALYFLATTETNISEKRRLLNEASQYGEKTIDLSEHLFTFYYWVRVVWHNYCALITAELAEIETNNQEKVDLLRKAVVEMENCLRFCERGAEAWSRTRYLGFIGQYQYWFGGILNQLYLLTGETKHLERAIRVCEDAAQTWGKVDGHSRIAEAYWQMAKLCHQLGNHSRAAREFESASEKYTLAAEKIPQLEAFYNDYALYMRVWSEIEKARHCHGERQYGLAKERYEKVADLYESTERWSYLSPEYSAWARLEEAEILSRSEQTPEARDLFLQAAKLFVDAKTSIKAKLERIETSDEKRMATELVKASDTREDYCLGRTALEEGKILDRKGNHAASSVKYGAAAEKFQKATDAMEHESDRQELKPIISLCQAWQMMTRAEAEASPDLYLEASKLFDEAKTHSIDEKARILALGHSRFCKALEAGTRFEDTRDPAFHSEAIRHLESSANHYIKAGFKTASEYARATHRLFDAYIYIHKAETETEPTKKAQYYQMTEKLLQASAGSYMKAKHPEKSEEIGRLLESVKEDRQLAVSLTDVLHVPTTASTTASFPTLTPTYEEAVGLEIFEHAHVQANLIIQEQSVSVGEDVALEIEMVNAGKGAATLVKVEDFVPMAEFKVVDKPQMYRVEESHLNMRGKRLEPLKTEDVRIVAKPRTKGKFIMKPRILYLDETGKYKSHEPEPVTITVKELGIKGWIKGEK